MILFCNNKINSSSTESTHTIQWPSTVCQRPLPRGTCFPRISTYKEYRSPRHRRRIGTFNSNTTLSHSIFCRLPHSRPLPSCSTAGFLRSGGQAPAFDSRILLIMAGDVEVNPGPKIQNQRTCHGCKKTIRSNHIKSALKCTVKGCTSICHKKPNCCQIGRYRSKDH